MFVSPHAGDVTPENTFERCCSIFIMLIGAAMFAFVISQVGYLVRELSKTKDFHRSLMDQLGDFAAYRQLPSSLTYDIRRYFQHRRRWRNPDSDAALLAAMSTDLRQRVMKHIYFGNFRRSFLVQHFSADFQDRLMERMQSKFGHNGERLYVPGDSSDYLYSICSGHVCVHDPRNGIQTLGPGDVFGENELLFGCPRRGRATCLSYCDLALAPRSVIVGLLNQDKAEFEELRRKEAVLLWAEAIQCADRDLRLYKLSGKFQSCARQTKHRRRNSRESSTAECAREEDQITAIEDAAAAQAMTRYELERAYLARGRQLKRLEARAHSAYSMLNGKSCCNTNEHELFSHGNGTSPAC
jgi:CRP-like cAMP-binding protein